MINCIHKAVQLNLTVLTHVPGAIFKTSFSIIFFFSALQKISFKISYEGRIKSRPSNRFYNSEFNNNQSNKKPMNLNWTHCKPIIKYVLIDFKYEKTSRSHLRPTSFFHPSSYKKIWLKRWWSWIWKRAQHRNKRSIVFSQ